MAVLISYLRFYIATIVLTLVTLISATAAPTDTKDNNTTTILVMGDSISAAYGIDIADGWVSRLQGWLQDRSAPESSQAPRQYRIINASISGETTSGGLRRLPALLETHQPAIVVIELGGNDGLQGHPIGRIRENLAALVASSQAAGARVLLVGMQIPPNYGKRYASEFYESYRLTAQHYQVLMVPFLLEHVATNPQLMQADGIHPKAEAQQQMLENLLPHLQQLL